MKYIILTLLLLFTLTGCSYSEQQNTGNYNAKKVSSQYNTSYEHKEQELASFTTTIYTKTDARQTNVKLACQELSGTVVEPRTNFFFLQYFRSCPT